MKDYLLALALAAMPAAGNLVGGVLAEIVTVSQRVLSLALHLAGGIIFAVVAVELVPQSFSRGPPWVMILLFVGGGGFFILVDSIIDVVSKRTGKGIETEATTASGAQWAIFFGVAVDLFSDGVMIGAGTTVNVGLGLLLALGQVPADIPEGFATIAGFRRHGVPRRVRLLASAAFAIPILIGTTIGYFAVRGRPDEVKLGLLAFTAGILTTVAVEEIMREAHRKEQDSRWATACFIGGFAVFALLSSYLE